MLSATSKKVTNKELSVSKQLVDVCAHSVNLEYTSFPTHTNTQQCCANKRYYI